MGSGKAFSGGDSSKSRGAIFEILPPLFLFRRRDKGKNKSGIIENIPKSSSGSGFHSTILDFIAAIRKSMKKKIPKNGKKREVLKSVTSKLPSCRGLGLEEKHA